MSNCNDPERGHTDLPSAPGAYERSGERMWQNGATPRTSTFSANAKLCRGGEKKMVDVARGGGGGKMRAGRIGGGGGVTSGGEDGCGGKGTGQR